TGIPYASLYSAGLTGTIATRRAQLEAYRDGRGLKAAKAFVLGKVQNQTNLLRYMAKYRKEREPDLYEVLQRAVVHLHGFQEAVRGTEGMCIEDVRESLLGLEGQ
ncbi:MAG: CRISPR-associated endonuclease Cas1, partial [Armatimonadota bacterium]